MESLFFQFLKRKKIRHQFHSKSEAESRDTPHYPQLPVTQMVGHLLNPPNRQGQGRQGPQAWGLLTESPLLVLTLSQLLEPGAEARNGALLDGAERMSSIFIPCTLGSAASLLIGCLGATHWKEETVLSQSEHGESQSSPTFPPKEL